MDYDELKNFCNSTDYFAQKQGIVLQAIGPGYARAAKDIRPEDISLSSSIHCGTFYCLSDIAANAALATTGYYGSLVSFDFRHFASGRSGDTLTAEAQEIQHQHKLYAYEVRITNQDHLLLSTGTLTYLLTDQPILFSMLF